MRTSVTFGVLDNQIVVVFGAHEYETLNEDIDIVSDK